MNTAAERLPAWFRQMGVGAWLLVGVMLVLVGVAWLLSQVSTIANPLIAGAVFAAVAGGLVDRLETHRCPRPVGAGLVLLGVVGIGVGVALMVYGGISSQGDQINSLMTQAVDQMQSWLKDIGVTSTQATDSIKKDVPDIGHTLLTGVAHGISGLKSLLVFLGFSMFITFFLLMDGPQMGRWVESHMGMRPEKARIVMGEIAHALRKYFLGLTIIGLFNAVLVGLGAVVLGLPLPGTIAVVTFLASYVPILGAWTAGFFAVAIALADSGSSTALIMALIVFLANGPLQQIVAPITYGATLSLNPLVVFVVTIAAGSLFGMFGLILGAPLVSAAVQINKKLNPPAVAETPI